MKLLIDRMNNIPNICTQFSNEFSDNNNYDLVIASDGPNSYSKKLW